MNFLMQYQLNNSQKKKKYSTKDWLKVKKINIKKLENKTNFKFLKNQNFIEYSPKGIKYLKDIMKFIDRYKGGLLIIDYGYYEEKFQNTLKAIYNKKHSNLLENIKK